MHWLNINLSTLRSPAYLGSTPVERATWLQLLAYCADQENGGRIAGAALWKDRQWQQTCGVAAREVRAASRLIAIEGEDVRVAFYPLEKQAEVQARRVAATDAANRRWHGKLHGGGAGGGEAGPPPVSGRMHAPPDASRIAPVHAEEKENGKEWNENGNGTHSPPAVDVCNTPPANQPCVPGVCAPACSSRDAVEHGARLVPPCPEQWCLKWWEDCERRGWVDRDGIPVRRWQPALSSYWRGVQEMERRMGLNSSASGTATPGGNSAGHSTGNGNGNGNGGNGHAPPPPRERAMSAYEINTRLGAIDDELSRLRMRAKDGRSEDGLRIVKIYAPEEEARRVQLLKAKEILKRKLTEV